MTTLYFVNAANEDGETLAFETQAEGKEAARKAHEHDGLVHDVVKVDLNKALGVRGLMCALFNGETDKFAANKETVYSAPTRGRGRPTKEEAPPPAEEENPFDI